MSSLVLIGDPFISYLQIESISGSSSEVRGGPVAVRFQMHHLYKLKIFELRVLLTLFRWNDGLLSQFPNRRTGAFTGPQLRSYFYCGESPRRSFEIGSLLGSTLPSLELDFEQTCLIRTPLTPGKRSPLGTVGMVSFRPCYEA